MNDEMKTAQEEDQIAAQQTESASPNQEETRPDESIDQEREEFIERFEASSKIDETDDEELMEGEEYEDEDEYEEGEEIESGDSEVTDEAKPRKRRKRRRPKRDAEVLRLLGRRALCKRIEDIAPHMKKTVMHRVLLRYLKSTRGMKDTDLVNRLIKDARKIAHKDRILKALNHIDQDADRRNLKQIIIHAILLQEETHSLEENRLDDKVLEFEKNVVKRAKKLDFFDPKEHDPIRWHHYGTYRICLDAAWRNDDDISEDEASLLKVLRDRLNISQEEHWLIGAHIKRFPKEKCALHTREEIHDARKELQRESILWSYQDDDSNNLDVLPFEVVEVIRKEDAHLELQRTNYRRILQHDSINVPELRKILQHRDMDRYGNMPDLIERIVNSDITPRIVLDDLNRSKLSEMCFEVSLNSTGNKPELIERLIEFYDDLTFVERSTKDEREVWFNNYELLAARAYSDLRAKKIISKDLEIEHQFEKATDFLFETKLNAPIDKSRKITKADGRILLEEKQVILWDCKSDEKEVNVHDFLENQFDGYLRRECTKGFKPLAFLVIGPSFTSQSIKAAAQYKAQTNWAIALIQADALKYLADRWSATEPTKPFPVTLLNRTEVIDKERVDFLLSLA